MSSQCLLPGSPSAPPRGLLERALNFLLRRWLGRILLGCLALYGAEKAGVPLPGWLGSLNDVLLVLFLGGSLLRLLAWTIDRFLWRIRTKLILSYLFIAVVPVVLLAAFFGVAGLLFSALVASHMVVSEAQRKAELLKEVARTALASLPLHSPPSDALLEQQMAAARDVHPKSRLRAVGQEEDIAELLYRLKHEDRVQFRRVLLTIGEARREIVNLLKGAGGGLL